MGRVCFDPEYEIVYKHDECVDLLHLMYRGNTE